jgi:hypothetical protein
LLALVASRHSRNERRMSVPDEIRILSPTGVCGSGFLESSFEKALAWQPHFIGCDAGSTDPGPAHLGTGEAAFPRQAVKRDLRIMLMGARLRRHRGR